MDETTCGVAAATLASYEAAEELERRQSDTSEFQMAVENLARAFCDSSAAFEEMAAFAETLREVFSCIGGDGRRLKRRKKICRSSSAPSAALPLQK
ncbi:MAG: hypothetical protein IK104_01230 [Clostridia bacterium]|nr:hypothetical protein [Clostridia bacterium]